MFKIVSKLLLGRQLSFSEGKISMFDQEICMMPIHTFVRFQKELEKRKMENMIYTATKNSGHEWYENLYKGFKMKSLEEQLKWGINVMSLAGWGNLKIKDVDMKKKRVYYVLENSTVAEHYGIVKKMVDHLFRGYLAGSNNFFFNVESEAVETKCLANGDSHCEFVVKPRKDFDFSNPLVKKQLTTPPSTDK